MTSQYIETETEISVAYPAEPYDDEIIWDRLESFCNFRWSETVMEFVVNPPHEIKWVPPYQPFVITEVNGEPAEPDEYGAVKIRDKSIIRCTIGGANPDKSVKTAYTRLEAYFASENEAPAGVQRYSVTIGDISETYSMRSDHLSRAMQNSGAADLLRKFRKAGLAHV